MEEDENDERLVQLELVCEADGVASQIPFNLDIATIAGAILMRNSAEHVPPLHRIAYNKAGHVLELLAVHAHICTDVARATVRTNDEE